MPLPFNLSCVSDCFKQTAPININVEQPKQSLENNLTAIIGILVPLIEKIVIEYIEKRFPSQKEIKEPLNENN